MIYVLSVKNILDGESRTLSSMSLDEPLNTKCPYAIPLEWRSFMSSKVLGRIGLKLLGCGIVMSFASKYTKVLNNRDSGLFSTNQKVGSSNLPRRAILKRPQHSNVLRPLCFDANV